MIVLWLSRNAPLPSQVAELRRLFGPDTTVQQDSRTFGEAALLMTRIRESGAAEVVIVAPLSLIAQLCRLGLRPLWAQMERVDRCDPRAEITAQRGVQYRFVEFRRIAGIDIRFEPVNPAPNAGK